MTKGASGSARPPRVASTSARRPRPALPVGSVIQGTFRALASSSSLLRRVVISHRENDGQNGRAGAGADTPKRARRRTHLELRRRTRSRASPTASRARPSFWKPRTTTSSPAKREELPQPCDASGRGVKVGSFAAALLGCRRGERRLELTARRDSQLREYAVEVRADGAVGQVEPLAYLAVGEPFRGKVGDLELLGGQLIAGRRIPTPARLP